MSRSRTDLAVAHWARLSAGGAAAAVILIIVSVLVEAWPALREPGLSRFLEDASWHPTEGTYGMFPMLVGSLGATAIALAVAAPLGVASAMFCRYFAPVRVAGLYRKVIELLAGIPSVVYGFWGITVLVPFIAQFEPPGASLLAGGLIIGLMILPTVALLSEAAIMNVPAGYTRAAAAVGLSRWAALREVVLPSAAHGIFTGLMLATGRAIGETMAALMVCGNVVQNPSTVFDPVRTLTANIALEMGYAAHGHRAALFVSAVLLCAAVLGLVVVADRLQSRASHG